MSKRARMGLLAGLLAGAATLGWGAPDRVGVVRLEVLLKAHPDTAPAEAILERQRKEYEEERSAMLAEHERLRRELEQMLGEAENRALSAEARDLKVAEFKAKNAEFRAYEQQIRDVQMERQKELLDRGRRMRERIIGKLRERVKAHADKNGYSIVLNAEDAGVSALAGLVLYHKDDVDLTDVILKAIADE